MHVRVATISDAPEMHRIRTSVRENTLTDYSILTPELYRDHLERLGRGWVAECDGKVVGMAIVNARNASIWALFVHPAWEGHGIGRQLHDTMLEWLKSEGLCKVKLETESGTRAERFYKAAGWRITGHDKKGQTLFEMVLAE